MDEKLFEENLPLFKNDLEKGMQIMYGFFQKWEWFCEELQKNGTDEQKTLLFHFLNYLEEKYPGMAPK